MTRPTREQLAKAAYELESLAYEDQDMFHLFAKMLDKAEWIRAEIAFHKDQAGYKRSSEVAPIGAGGGSSVEAQFADHATPRTMYRTDEMVREAQKLRRTWISQLQSQEGDMYQRAGDLGYPHRSVDEGWRLTWTGG